MPAILAYMLAHLAGCNGSFVIRGWPPGGYIRASWTETTQPPAGPPGSAAPAVARRSSARSSRLPPTPPSWISSTSWFLPNAPAPLLFSRSATADQNKRRSSRCLPVSQPRDDYKIQPPTDLEASFRHSGWHRMRLAVFQAMLSVIFPEPPGPIRLLRQRSQRVCKPCDGEALSKPTTATTDSVSLVVKLEVPGSPPFWLVLAEISRSDSSRLHSSIRKQPLPTKSTGLVRASGTYEIEPAGRIMLLAERPSLN